MESYKEGGRGRKEKERITIHPHTSFLSAASTLSSSSRAQSILDQKHYLGREGMMSGGSTLEDDLKRQVNRGNTMIISQERGGAFMADGGIDELDGEGDHLQAPPGRGDKTLVYMVHEREVGGPERDGVKEGHTPLRQSCC